MKPSTETRIKNVGIRKSNLGKFYGYYQKLLSEQVDSEKENLNSIGVSNYIINQGVKSIEFELWLQWI